MCVGDVNLSGCVTLNGDICFNNVGFGAVVFYFFLLSISLWTIRWEIESLFTYWVWKAILFVMTDFVEQSTFNLCVYIFKKNYPPFSKSGCKSGEYFILFQWIYTHRFSFPTKNVSEYGKKNTQYNKIISTIWAAW